MSITFSVDEIFEMAEQIERNGAKFYRKAAEAAAGESARRRLETLAVMEEDHQKTFATMRDELPARQRMPTTFDPDDEEALYLQAMVDGKVFDAKADPFEQFAGAETMEDILQTAIGLEKDSIVFYLGVKDLVPSSRGKDKIDNIIREEMNHITVLSHELASLKL